MALAGPRTAGAHLRSGREQRLHSQVRLQLGSRLRLSAQTLPPASYAASKVPLVSVAAILAGPLRRMLCLRLYSMCSGHITCVFSPV